MNALEVHDLTKRFGGQKVTRGVSLSVAAGERRLIIGPNGAGKTTLFNLIAGDLRPDSGSIKLFGTDITKLPVWSRAPLGLARTFQIITLFPSETLLKNVVLAIMGTRRDRWDPSTPLSWRQDAVDQAHAVLETVGLASLAGRPAAALSYGEKRRAEIAMALAQNPKVLLLDEPYAGLSNDERRIVQRLLATVPDAMAMVMIEHDMDIALEFAGRVSVLHLGEIVFDGTRQDVVNDARTREVYLGY
ncbi:branched-chain amino acid transport system ATP-binding protein [Nitrobacteraceae bacterium AZCC 2161]